MNVGVRRPTVLSNQLHSELLKDTAMDGEVRVTYKPLADRKQVRHTGPRMGMDGWMDGGALPDAVCGPA